MIYIRRHQDDPEIVEIYTLRKRRFMDEKTSFILWATVHEDFLDELNVTFDDLSDCEYTLKAVRK